MNLKYLADHELADADTGEVRLQEGFGERIDLLREKLGFPMIVNTAMHMNRACRSPAQNTLIGGHWRSLHMIGNPAHGTDTCAIDVESTDRSYRGRLFMVAWSLGFSIGWGRGFLHIDDRTRVIGLAQTTFDY